MEQKTLIEYLTGSLEHERVLAVSDLIYQVDSYVRALAQAIGGLSVNSSNDSNAFRNFCAVRRTADELSAWLCAHHKILCEHVGVRDILTPAEAQDELQEQTTFH